MTIYRDDPKAIRALVRADSVHRDVYIDGALFDVEMEQLWRNAWIYVGHDSQVPEVGDFYSTLIGKDPVILVRAADERVRVLSNRCAHRGTKLVSAVHGKCLGGCSAVPITVGPTGSMAPCVRCRSIKGTTAQDLILRRHLMVCRSSFR